MTDHRFRVVIMSNQGGINLRPDPKSIKGNAKRLNIFKEKVAAVLGQLDIPMHVYAATGQDKHRKPRTGMWEQMRVDFNLQSPQSIDLKGSFFVGDAGGRSGVKGMQDDHACSDRCVARHSTGNSTSNVSNRNLAANVGIAFHTPEEFFLGEPTRDYKRTFDPKKYLHGEGASDVLRPRRPASPRC